jgi:hypothetical protein
LSEAATNRSLVYISPDLGEPLPIDSGIILSFYHGFYWYHPLLLPVLLSAINRLVRIGHSPMCGLAIGMGIIRASVSHGHGGNWKRRGTSLLLPRTSGMGAQALTG